MPSLILFLRITLLFLALALAFFTELLPDRIKKIKYYKPILGFLLIVVFVFSTILEISANKKEVADSYQRTLEANRLLTRTTQGLEKSANGLNAIVQQKYLTDFNIDKTRIALDQLLEIERKSDSLKNDLVNYTRLIDSIKSKTNSLLQSNQDLLNSQIKQYEKYARKEYSIYPFHLLVSTQYSIDDSKFKKLIDKIVDSVLKDRKLSTRDSLDIYVERDIKDNDVIKRISILNYNYIWPDLYREYSFMHKFQIMFMADSVFNIQNNFSPFNSVYYLVPNYIVSSSPIHSGRKQFSRLVIDFVNRQLLFHTYFNDFTQMPYNNGQKYISKFELYNYNMIISGAFPQKGIGLYAMQLYLNPEFTTNLPVILSNPLMNKDYGYYFMHKFHKMEIERVGLNMDNYKLFYYDRPNAFDLPDPANY